jgi:hypothetical protein
LASWRACAGMSSQRVSTTKRASAGVTPERRTMAGEEDMSVVPKYHALGVVSRMGNTWLLFAARPD